MDIFWSRTGIYLMFIKHQHYDLLKHVILERAIFQPPIHTPADMQNEACFLYLVNGQSVLHSPTETIPLSANEGVVMKCGNYLNRYLSSESDSPYEVLAVHFYPEVLRMVYKDEIPVFLKQDIQPTQRMVEKVKVDAMMRQYVDNLRFYFENPSLINDELVILKVKELVLLLVNSDETGKVQEILRDLFNPAVYSFKQVIHQHLLENVSVEQLAFLTNLSVSSFKRKFKEVFNDSPGQYIRTKRLEKAVEMLKINHLRIMDIAYDCGFNDVGHFSKSFSQQYGCPPSEYRERLLDQKTK